MNLDNLIKCIEEIKNSGLYDDSTFVTDIETDDNGDVSLSFISRMGEISATAKTKNGVAHIIP